MILSRSLAEVKRVISTRKFRRDFKRGIIFSLSFLSLFVFFKVQPSFALDKLEIEKKKRWFTASPLTIGVLSGIGVVGITSFTIYSLYRENSLLKASLKVANSTISHLELSTSLFDFAFQCPKCICE